MTTSDPDPRPPLRGGAVTGGVFLGFFAIPISIGILGGVGALLDPVGSGIALVGGIVGWVFAIRAILRNDRSLGLGIIWGISGWAIILGACVAIVVAVTASA